MGKQTVRTQNNLKGFLLVLFILFSTDSLLVTTNLDRIPARISWLFIVLFFVFVLCKVRVIHSKRVVPVAILSFCIALSMLAHHEFGIFNYVQRIMLVILCFLLSELICYHDFMGYFIKVMRIIAIVSLLGFTFSSFVLTHMNYLPTIKLGEIAYAKSLFFTNVRSNYIRNFGPFWEPGAFQMYLNWAIFYEMRFQSKFNVKDIILFSITVITTLSTTGVVLLGIEFIYFIFATKDIKKLKSHKFFFFITVLVVVFLFLETSLSNYVFDKVLVYLKNPNVSNGGSVSTYTRVNSIFANLEMMRISPIFGVGIKGTEEILNRYSITSNTNTILGVGATYGILSMMVYVTLLLKGKNNCGKGVLSKICYILIVLIIYSTEALLVSFFFTIVIFYEAQPHEDTVMVMEQKS